MDHQVSASMQTPFDTCILDLFCAKPHAQTQEQPVQSNNNSEMENDLTKRSAIEFQKSVREGHTLGIDEKSILFMNH